MVKAPSFEKIASLSVQMASREKVVKAAEERLKRAQAEYDAVANNFRLIKAAYEEALSKRGCS